MRSLLTKVFGFFLGGLLGWAAVSSVIAQTAESKVTELVVGMTAPLTGPLAEFGTAFKMPPFWSLKRSTRRVEFRQKTARSS